MEGSYRPSPVYSIVSLTKEERGRPWGRENREEGGRYGAIKLPECYSINKIEFLICVKPYRRIVGTILSMYLQF